MALQTNTSIKIDGVQYPNFIDLQIIQGVNSHHFFDISILWEQFSEDGNAIISKTQSLIGKTLEILITDLAEESTSSTEFFDWMACPDERKSGSVTFYRRDAMSRLKRLDFTDALCVSYHEYFHAEGKLPMTTKMKLSAREIVLENVSVVNDWNAEA